MVPYQLLYHQVRVDQIIMSMEGFPTLSRYPELFVFFNWWDIQVSNFSPQSASLFFFRLFPSSILLRYHSSLFFFFFIFFFFRLYNIPIQAKSILFLSAVSIIVEKQIWWTETCVDEGFSILTRPTISCFLNWKLILKLILWFEDVKVTERNMTSNHIKKVVSGVIQPIENLLEQLCWIWRKLRLYSVFISDLENTVSQSILFEYISYLLTKNIVYEEILWN